MNSLKEIEGPVWNSFLGTLISKVVWSTTVWHLPESEISKKKRRFARWAYKLLMIPHNLTSWLLNRRYMNVQPIGVILEGGCSGRPKRRKIYPSERSLFVRLTKHDRFRDSRWLVTHNNGEYYVMTGTALSGYCWW